MQQRGRKSAASLSVVAGSIDGRPKPPSDLTKFQTDVWERTVANEAADVFRTAALQQLLKEYCRHVESAHRLSEVIDRSMATADDPVFERLAKAVISGSKLSCEWQIPPPPPGKTFTPSQTNVSYGTSGTPTRRQIPWVDSAVACSSAKDGWAWYYDDNVRPTKIMVCPQACTGIQADATAKIDIAFGCPTVIVPK